MPTSTPIPPINPDRLRSRLEALAAIGADPAGGISRFPYSDAHAEAVRTVAAWMAEAGLTAGCDQFGTLVGTRPGARGWPAILLGSHLDTVPRGGMFDGALGVLAGVEVAQALREGGCHLDHGLAVVGFADEEGFAFGAGTLASRCLVGAIAPAQRETLCGYDGRTLAEALAAFAPGPPPAMVPSPAAAYLELHVEQGPVLVQSGRRIAAVSAITGIARARAVLEGEANHAGTTPMALRRDALVGAAEVILAVRGLVEAMGPPAVGTVGTLAVPSGASNIVPGRVEFPIEIRSPDAVILNRLRGQIDKAVQRIAQRRGLVHQMSPWDHRDPVPMDARVHQAILDAIADAACEPYSMPSGAGHDAMILAPHVPSGMIFVPSIGGISHSPRERTDWADCALGAEVLLRTVLRLDEGGPLPAHPIAAEGSGRPEVP